MSDDDRAQISGYVEEREKRVFKAHANAADLSHSKWVVQACREKVQREALANDAQRYRVEQRLMALVEDAADRIVDEISEELGPAVAEHVLTALAAADVIDLDGTAIDPAPTDGLPVDDEEPTVTFSPDDRPELPNDDDSR